MSDDVIYGSGFAGGWYKIENATINLIGGHGGFKIRPTAVMWAELGSDPENWVSCELQMVSSNSTVHGNVLVFVEGFRHLRDWLLASVGVAGKVFEFPGNQSAPDAQQGKVTLTSLGRSLEAIIAVEIPYLGFSEFGDTSHEWMMLSAQETVCIETEHFGPAVKQIGELLRFLDDLPKQEDVLRYVQDWDLHCKAIEKRRL